MKSEFLKLAGLEISEAEAEKLERHWELLQKWNAKINLVSRASLSGTFENHYVDSLHISRIAAKLIESLPVFDIGSGGGFPGIMFAILNPARKISMFEKNTKKRSFLLDVISSLNLSNVALGGEFPDKAHGFILARAVMPPNELLDFLLPRVEKGSRILIPMGGEKGEIANSGFKNVAEERYSLPHSGDRAVLILEKS